MIKMLWRYWLFDLWSTVCSAEEKCKNCHQKVPECSQRHKFRCFFLLLDVVVSQVFPADTASTQTSSSFFSLLRFLSELQSSVHVRTLIPPRRTVPDTGSAPRVVDMQMMRYKNLISLMSHSLFLGEGRLIDTVLCAVKTLSGRSKVLTFEAKCSGKYMESDFL